MWMSTQWNYMDQWNYSIILYKNAVQNFKITNDAFWIDFQNQMQNL